jgi:2-dehydro-3-deoxygluconokinase
MSYDIVTFGETMIRFTPPGFTRLEAADTLEMHVGGSESNTAIGLARLGRKVVWLSRLTANPLGKLIAGKIAAHGVDVSHVVWTDEDRVGTYYLERGSPPRTTQVIYDRQNSAVSRMVPAELPASLFQKNSAKLFHTTGIALGISATAASTAIAAAGLAKAAGWTISFDLNYRSKLWSAEECRAGCTPMMEMSDIVFMPIRDAKTILEVKHDSPDEVSRAIAQLFPKATIVLTLGSQGSSALQMNGEFVTESAFPLVEVDRLGGGDAFSAGFLHAFLDGQTYAECLRWGNAVAALKYSIPGDLPIIDRAQVLAMLAGNPHQGIVR